MADIALLLLCYAGIWFVIAHHHLFVALCIGHPDAGGQICRQPAVSGLQKAHQRVFPVVAAGGQGLIVGRGVTFVGG